MAASIHDLHLGFDFGGHGSSYFTTKLTSFFVDVDLFDDGFAVEPGFEAGVRLADGEDLAIHRRRRGR